MSPLGNIEVKLTGVGTLETLTASLARKAGTVGTRGAQVVRRNAARIEQLSKQLVPVDTGATKNSIGVDTAGDGRFAAITATIGPTTGYAHFLERGTSRRAPRPFMVPALNRVTPGFVADCEALAGDVDA